MEAMVDWLGANEGGGGGDAADYVVPRGHARGSVGGHELGGGLVNAEGAEVETTHCGREY